VRYDVSKERLDLLRRIQAHDLQAMGMLYDQLAPLVYTVVLHILGSPAEAEDTLLETFQQVWHGVTSYDPLHGSVERWVLTLARHQALTRLRAAAQPRHAVPFFPQEGTTAPPPCTLASDSSSTGNRTYDEQRRVVRAALAALPAEQRLALELAYYQGLSPAEMGQRLGQPLGTMQTRVRLGLQQLRSALQPYLGVRP
jgi:RNA polymerase sigma-70 factor (ECF subfamily)